MTWFKNFEPLSLKSRFMPEHNFYSNLATLTISDVRPEDAGIYTCIAENNLGQDQTSSEASITKTPNVDANPIMNPDSFRNLNKPLDFPVDILPVEEYFFPPKIIIPHESIKCKEGAGIVFTCKIDGFPKPEVLIKRNLLKLNSLI